jgi:hypothetical protein
LARWGIGRDRRAAARREIIGTHPRRCQYRTAHARRFQDAINDELPPSDPAQVSEDVSRRRVITGAAALAVAGAASEAVSQPNDKEPSHGK